MEMMDEAGIGVEHLQAFMGAPKYQVNTPYGDVLELQAFPKVSGLKYPGWMVLHDSEGTVYIKDWNDTEVCRYNEDGDTEYVGSIDIDGLWSEVAARFSIQNTLLRPWHHFPAKVSLKDIRDWFEDEFAVSFSDGEPVVEAC
jgi:hypothetical protein